MTLLMLHHYVLKPVSQAICKSMQYLGGQLFVLIDHWLLFGCC